MVRQVLITEKVIVDGTTRIEEGQLAFGTHSASFFDDDDGAVVTAIALGAQEIRIVLDELVRGNKLEEMACADGTFSRIPDGTTPDDVARCAGPVDSILSCTEVCIGADGKPVGILDADEDGAADDMRMIDYNADPDIVELGISVVCDGQAIPLDPEFSFWTPSGNQTFPSNNTLGFRGLGPAIVAKPLAASGLRTGSNCSIAFRPEVIDYDGNPICAPTNGLISEDCSGGDTTKISFGTEPLALTNSVPADASVGVGLDGAFFILLSFNANVDASTVSAISMTAGAAPVTINPIVQEEDATSIVIMLDDPFEPATDYTMTVSTDLKDLLGGTLAENAVVTWSTDAFGLDDSNPNDGATNVALEDSAAIELDFNGAVDGASLAAITLTAGGVDVPVTPALDAMDASLVLIDLGANFDPNEDYVLTVSTALLDANGGALPAEEVISWATTGLALASSAPASGDVDVLLDAGIVLTFNTAVDAATVAAAVTLTADAVLVAGTTAAIDGADPTIINVTLMGTGDFDPNTAYVLTVATTLLDAAGGALAADAVVSWTTGN